MVATRFMIGALATAVLITPALAVKQSGPSLQDRQQAACYDDVQRLCASAMPDVNKVTECMKPKKAEVSEKCRALWDVK